MTKVPEMEKLSFRLGFELALVLEDFGGAVGGLRRIRAYPSAIWGLLK